MHCEQEFCIYNKEYECVLCQISINPWGFCDECILVLPDYDTLEEKKLAILEKYGQGDYRD